MRQLANQPSRIDPADSPEMNQRLTNTEL